MDGFRVSQILDKVHSLVQCNRLVCFALENIHQFCAYLFSFFFFFCLCIWEGCSEKDHCTLITVLAQLTLKFHNGHRRRLFLFPLFFLPGTYNWTWTDAPAMVPSTPPAIYLDFEDISALTLHGGATPACGRVSVLRYFYKTGVKT